MENNKKYVVYENDLKFKNMQNIDPDKAEWYDDSLKELFGKDFDTVKARLKECKNGGFNYLDLSRLNLEKMPKLTGYTYYDQLIKIKYLFLNDNNLTECGPRLNDFESLEVLDISHNKIENITYLPLTLTEFICHNNELQILQSHDKIKILDCMNNKIQTIGTYPNLKDLICINNNLKILQSYPSVERIICKQNPIETIENQPKLKLLDCSETKVKDKLDGMPNLTGLICNFTGIIDITSLKLLESLEIVGCSMNIPYIRTLKCLLCENAKDTIQISKKYKIKNIIAEGTSLCCIFDESV